MGFYLTRLVLIIFFFLQGCTNPSIINVNQSELDVISDQSRIFIPRFEGRPDFVEESTDYFISILESNIPNTILQGPVLRLESTDISKGANLAPLELALKAAKDNKADSLIFGKVTSHNTIGTLNGFSTIRVYNVQTGNRIANFHRPSGLLIAYSEHQCVMAAVKKTAEDVLELF